MADTAFDLVVIGAGPGGYVAAIRAVAARHEDRDRRARKSRRHLPQLGLHPDQGAAAILRNLSSAAPAGRVRLFRQGHLLRREKDRRALAQGGGQTVGRRRLPDEEAQDHRVRRHREAEGQGRHRADGQGRQAAAGSHRQEHHPRDRSPRPHAARPRTRRQADLDLSRSHGARRHAEIAAGRRLGRDRHGVRQLLPHARGEDHGRRSAGPHPACRGRGGLRIRPQGLRQAGHEDPHRPPR